MISKQRCLFYFVGTEAFKSLEEAQKHDLRILMPDGQSFGGDVLADWLLENKASIVDILTTTPTSRAKARKLHGGVRKKKVNPTESPMAQMERKL